MLITLTTIFRVDREFYLENCNIPQAKGIFRNFFPCSSEEDVAKLGQILEIIREPFSPAQFQGYLLRFKKSSSDALENIHILKDSLKKEVDYAEDNSDSGRASSTTELAKKLADVEESKDNENVKDWSAVKDSLESNKTVEDTI